jgi:ABC-type transport system substrate-binding protein
VAVEDLGLRYWTTQRLTRRRMLGATATGAAALTAWGLVGCSGSDDDDGGNGEVPQGTAVVNDGTQDGPPKPGGILRVRQNPALPSMNPFGPGIFALAQQLTLGFTVFDHPWYTPTDTGVRELFLATGVEQPDDLTVIATIGDARFHDKAPVNGRKIDAEDIVQSMLRFRREAPIGYSWLHEILETVEAVDEKTVKYVQNRPWAWFFTSSNAGSPISSSILPKEILEDTDFMNTDAIGSSHWMLDSHENGANIKLRRFPNFRTFQNGKDITGQPYLNGIDFKYISDNDAALAAFRAGETDVGGFTTRKQMEDAISEFGDRMVTGSDLSRDYITFMMYYKPPFNDLRVRQAFNLLINRDEMILLLEDGDAVKSGPVPPAHKRYALPEDDPAMQEFYRTDVAEARQLLEAASFDFDAEYTIRHSNRPVDSDLARVLQSQLGEGGVKIKLEQQDLVRWFSQTLNQSDFDLTCFQHLAYEDPDLPLRFYVGEGDITNFMKYSEPKVNDAILAAASELDEDARVQKTYDAQKVVMSEYAPMLNLLSGINFAGRWSYVKGSITGRGSYGLFNRTSWLDDESRRSET